MARITQPINQRMDAPVWAAHGLPHNWMVPGGAQLDTNDIAVGKTQTPQTPTALLGSFGMTNDLRKRVPAGTLVFRTVANRDITLADPRAATPTEKQNLGFKILTALTQITGFAQGVKKIDYEVYLTAFDVIDADVNPEIVLVRNDVIIYENWLWWAFPINLGYNTATTPAVVTSNPFLPKGPTAGGVEVTTAVKGELLQVLRTYYQTMVGQER